MLRPWVFDVTLAGVLLRAAPRPPVPIPVEAWARAYGLARDPGSGRHAISLIGPGPDFSPEYAMTTDPGEPVILATLAGASGEPAGPLLIDGCHRLYKAAVTGRAEIPAFVLTAAETLLIRSDAVLGPPRPAAAPGHRTTPAPPQRRRTPMLTGITTRTSTPQEDAEPWPGGSARPVLDYLTGTLGMTGSRRPGTAEGGAHRAGRGRAGHARRLPRPGRRRAPADPLRARQPRLQVQAHRPGERGTARHQPGTGHRAREPARPGRAATRPGNAARQPGRRRRRHARPGLPAPPGGAAQPGPAEITVTIWHNVAFDAQGRHTAMLDGYQPGDPMVRVFAYQADPGRPAEEIADEAFDIFNDHPRDAAGADLACAYYGRRLRSLSAGDVVAAGEVRWRSPGPPAGSRSAAP